MKFNNTWANHEDELFFKFTCCLDLPIKSYLEQIYEMNRSFHFLTYKYKLLMTLSPEYCENYGINYIDHYFNFLQKNKNTPEFFPTKGYEFYKNYQDRVSQVFFNNELGKLTSSYVHYISNGVHGNTQALINNPDIKENFDIQRKKFSYEESPLSIVAPIYIDNNTTKNTVTVSFSIESHCSFWLDTIPLFRFYNKNNDVDYLEHSNNKQIAYANTPRLNSFIREIREIITGHGGTCELYDYKSLISPDDENKKYNALKRVGLELSGEVIYQEDIDNIDSSSFLENNV